MTAESVRAHIAGGTLTEDIRFVPAHRGDVFFIPGGRVHAIGAGVTVAEIQQSSDVTYRLYDYGRLSEGKPRDLHIEQALEVLDYSDAGGVGRPGPWQDYDGGQRRVLVDCAYFLTAQIRHRSGALPVLGPWQGLLVTAGEAWISAGGESIHLQTAQTAYLPGQAEACGDFEALLFTAKGE